MCLPLFSGEAPTLTRRNLLEPEGSEPFQALLEQRDYLTHYGLKDLGEATTTPLSSPSHEQGILEGALMA